MLTISIAIPTYSRPDSVRRLLESIDRQVRLPDEVVLVDASPDEQTKKVVEAAGRRSQYDLKYVHSEKGLTRQRNRAIQETSSEVLVFLDDDVVLQPRYLVEIEMALNSHPDIAGVAGFIENQYARPITWSWRLFKLLGLLPGPYQEGRLLPYGMALPLTTLQPFQGLKDVEWLPGGATAWRREVFQHYCYSLFFEDYGLMEDQQFSLRVSRQARLALCGEARLLHLHEPGERPNYFWVGYYRVRNSLYILMSVLPEHTLGRYFQMLWYWIVEAGLNLFLAPLRGQGKASIPGGLGMTWGILTCGFTFRFRNFHV